MADRPQRCNSASSRHNSGGAQAESRPGSAASTARPLSVRLNSTSRQSFHESLRIPASPHSRRQQSLTQSAVKSLIDNPPARKTDPAFAGRDWTQITIGELARPTDLQFVEAGVSIEDATNLLIQNTDTRCLLIREKPEDKSVVGTFDFADLNAYLLLVVGLAQPEAGLEDAFRGAARKAKHGVPIPLRDVKKVAPSKEPLTMLPASADLRKAVETFGGGVHRVVVLKEHSTEVVGIFTQLRLVKFLWTNGESFPVIDRLYPQTLSELKVCSQQVQWISGDKPLYHALQVLHNEGLSSVAVVDNQMNVLGNISIVDVKLLTKSSSAPLLENSCAHFISIILSTRGLIDGQDSYPVFHVNAQSTLAHTIAKLAATKSHRMWVTDPASPAASAPSTPCFSSPHATFPSVAPVPMHPSFSLLDHEQETEQEQEQETAQQRARPKYRKQQQRRPSPPAPPEPQSNPLSQATSEAAFLRSAPPSETTPYPPAVSLNKNNDLPPPVAPPSLSVSGNNLPSAPSPAPAAAALAASLSGPAPIGSSSGMPMGLPTAAAAAAAATLTKPSSTALPHDGARLSGRLIGLVSLTDVLNLYARASGLRPLDPNISRSRRRRTSSSSSMGMRKSGELSREVFGR
ncbi:cell separation during budding [Ascosphaera atra]|nr:cell separation during budding [Ascosphaera atra]